MKILVVGATGLIGAAVADLFEAECHEVIRASRNGSPRLDIEDPDSIRSAYQKIGKLDAVVSCAGNAAYATLPEITDDQIAYTIDSKLIGQVNLVRSGLDYLNDGGVFVLTAGIFGTRPIPGVPAPAMVNGALESFARQPLWIFPAGSESVPSVRHTSPKLPWPSALPPMVRSALQTMPATTFGRHGFRIRGCALSWVIEHG